MSMLLLTLLSAFAGVALGTLVLVQALERQAGLWRSRFGADVRSGLRELFIDLDADRLFRLHRWLLAIGFGSLLWITGQPWVGLIGLLLAGALPGIAMGFLRRRRLHALAAQWPDAVMLVAAALRAGVGLQQALIQASAEMPSPTGRELELTLREQRIGVSLEQSLQHLEGRAGLEGVSLFVAAVRIAQDSGGNLAETLERLADSLRRKAALEGKIEALTAQGRLQGWVMVAMPIAVAAALFAIEPDAMRPLVTTSYGAAVCCAVVAAEGMGLYFIRRIVSIDV